MGPDAAGRSFWERLGGSRHPAWWLLAALFALVWGRGFLGGLSHMGMGDWDYFTSQSWVAYRSWFEFGQAPFWSPYHCGGQTLVGNYQSRAYSPSFLLNVVFGVQLGNRLYLLLALALGFEGTRRLMRRLGASGWASVFAAFAVAGNGAMLARFGVGHFGDVPYLFLPWWLLAIEQAPKRPFSSALIGGAWGALCLLEAGSYPLIYGGLLAGAWMGARSIEQRSARPLLGLAGVCAASLLLSMFVLWPSVAHLSQTLRPGVSAEHVPLSALPDVFLSTQIKWSRTSRFPEQHWGWWEYGCYVGPVFLLALLGAAARGSRVTYGWLALGALFVWYGMGDVHPGAPWSLAHELPVFRSLRASGRAFVPAVLCWSCAIVPVLSQMRFAPVVTLALALNLLWVVPPVLDGAFVHEVPAPTRPTPVFRQRADTVHMRQLVDENRTSMTLAVLRNEGALLCYEPARRKRFAGVADHADGEAFLTRQPGKVQVRWSPNELQLRTRGLSRPDVVVVNQNFHEDWVADDGRPVRALKGLLSAPVQAGDDVVTLRFEPLGFRLGLSIALITALLLGAAARRFESRDPAAPDSSCGPQ